MKNLIPLLCIVMAGKHAFELAKFRRRHHAMFLTFWVTLLAFHYTNHSLLQVVLVITLIAGAVTRKKH